MNEIIPGVYQIRLPIPNNPLEYTNLYLIKGNGENLLIDAGWNSEEALQSLKKQLAEIGVGLNDISQIIVTHAHPDHYGLVDRLRQLSLAKIGLHEIEKNLLEPRYVDTGGFLHQTREWLRINGVPDSELPTVWTAPVGGQKHSAPTHPDLVLQGGETISCGTFNLQTIWTPGHSPGHICLYEPEQRILFSGDHVLPVITPNVSLQPYSSANPLGDFINSLIMVKQLDVRTVLPAHEHLFTDLATRVDEIIWHHQQRNLEILEAIKAEPRTAYQISNEVTWMPEFGGVNFQDLAPWDRRMAVSETLSHLEAMALDGTVDKSSRDSVIYYRPNQQASNGKIELERQY